MSKDFKKPVFRSGDIELRFENEEVCIYATARGLSRLIEFCQMLLEDPKRGHIHMEDYEILTDTSLKGTIAIFKT